MPSLWEGNIMDKKDLESIQECIKFIHDKKLVLGEFAILIATLIIEMALQNNMKKNKTIEFITGLIGSISEKGWNEKLGLAQEIKIKNVDTK
jgi:hypothetical protein